MTRCLLLFTLLLAAPAFGQMTAGDYLADLDEGTRIVERYYSGYRYKVTERTAASYQAVKDSVRALVAEGAAPFEDAFGRYLAWFKDYHLHDLCGAQDKYMDGPVDYAARMEYAPKDVFRQVDANTFLIRHSSCVWSGRRMRWIRKAVRAFRKSGCDNLILDLRGNGGGSDGTSDPFIELLFDHDGFYNGIAIRNTPVSIGFFRKEMRKDRYWQTHLDACEQSGEEYPVLFEPHRIHYGEVSGRPVRAAVIIDNRTASSAEQLVLVLRRVSDRVTVFGKDHSLGCLDYANPRGVRLSRSGYAFRLPLTCTLGLPEAGIDAGGIVPDVIIDCEYPEKLTDNIDAWIPWVAARLQENQ
jgi:hypothetical protein